MTYKEKPRFTGNEKATVIISNKDEDKVYYHSTCIFHFVHANGKIHLNTDGYFTATTKKRINQSFDYFHIPAHLFQTRGQWLVNYANVIYPFTNETLTLNV
jgi:hypothetical protein